MKKLWQDLTHNRGAAALFLGYWLATAVTTYFTSHNGIPLSVLALLLSNSLIIGALVSWWRRPTEERSSSLGYRMRGGMLAGALSAEIFWLWGAIGELVGWLHHGGRFEGDQLLGFAVIIGFLGVFLGLVGSACSAILYHRPKEN